MSKFFALLCIVMVGAVSAAPMWGPAGHQITAAVAESILSKDILNQCQKILGGQTLEEVSTWADEVKHESQWKWSEPLHFINTPSWACDYQPSRDCSDQVCVAGAILNYTQRLSSASTSAAEKAIALKFLVHFHGDIEQPLHVAFAADRGGNDIKGTWTLGGNTEQYGHGTNLHAIWDSKIIENRLAVNFSNSQTAYISYLVSQVQGPWAGDAQAWSNCPGGSTELSCPNGWGNDTAGLACTKAYTDSQGNHIEDNFTLGEDYYQWTFSTVDVQLARGGVRLASTLQKILGGSSLPSNIN